MNSDLSKLSATFKRASQRIESARAQLGEPVVAYLSAILVDSAVDRQCMNLSPVWARFPTTIPRFIRLPGRVQNHPSITHFAFRCINRCWRILFPVMVMFQAIRFGFRKIVAKKQSVGGDEIVFANSPRAHEVLSPFVSKDAVWVTSASGTITDHTTCCILGNITWREFFAAVAGCLKINRQTASLIPSDGTHMQFYSVLEWNLTWFGMQRITANTDRIWFSNHYDRWAFLIDALPGKAETHLVQHGMLYSDRLIPSCLRNISTVYAFDADSETVFRELVRNPNVKFVRKNYSLTLTPVARRFHDEKIVLLVGNLLHVEDEKRLITLCLEMDSELRILVKPHPRSDQQHYQSIEGDRVQLVAGGRTFPDADVVLSPESTLGKEYEATGTAVVWYTRVSADDLRTQINTALNATRTSNEANAHAA